MEIRNATVINEGLRFQADVSIEGERIRSVRAASGHPPAASEIDATGLWLLPGVIDMHVHFREPGLTDKGDIASESRAAVAGGVTSFMDMPNTLPPTLSTETLNDKFKRASRNSLANYALAIGATNDNSSELRKEESRRAMAVKVFMGASTGNLLVDNPSALERIFSETDRIIAVHCEDEAIIRANKERYSELADQLDCSFHPKIRSSEACYKSSSQAVALAKKHGARLHLCHLSTAKEMDLLESMPLKEKRITAEVCVHHLWFSSDDYARLGNLIKWNPAIKTKADRDALRQALIDGKLDTVATDHAPHRLDEKQVSYPAALSGAPMVQHALIVMLELCRQGIFTPELVIDKMAHAPAECFNIKGRGYIREGYYADLVLVDPNQLWTVNKENLLYKCGWSPLEGTTFRHKVVKTFVNGCLVYDNGRFDENFRGKEINNEKIDGDNNRSDRNPQGKEE